MGATCETCIALDRFIYIDFVVYACCFERGVKFHHWWRNQRNGTEHASGSSNPVIWAYGQSINSIHQAIKPSSNQSTINQSINQSIHDSVRPSVRQSIRQDAECNVVASYRRGNRPQSRLIHKGVRLFRGEAQQAHCMFGIVYLLCISLRMCG
jgi:hypothetical protein